MPRPVAGPSEPGAKAVRYRHVHARAQRTQCEKEKCAGCVRELRGRLVGSELF